MSTDWIPPHRQSFVLIAGRIVPTWSAIIGIAVIFFIVACLCGGLLTKAGTFAPRMELGTPIHAPKPTHVPTHVPTQQVTYSPSATSTVTTTPLTLATATPKPKPQIVLHTNGNGNASSQPFTVHEGWQITLTCAGDNSSIEIDTYRVSDSSPTGDMLTYTCPTQGGETRATFYDSGAFYLSIIDNSATYDITVIDT